MIGQTRTTTLDADIRQLISRTFHISAETATVFHRVVLKGETYYSRGYNRTKTRNSYTIEYNNGSTGQQMFAFIKYFLSFSSHTAAVITPLQPTNEFCYPCTLRVLRSCIVPVHVESSVCLIPLSGLLHKCVCLRLPETTYIARLPNHVRIIFVLSYLWLCIHNRNALDIMQLRKRHARG